MADMNSTATAPTTPARRGPGRPPSKATNASETLPAYGLSGGPLSFREALQPRELGTIDRALAIVGRALRAPGVAFADPDAVRQYMRLTLGGEPVERFGVLYLDSQNRALAFEIMFNGTLQQTAIHPREVVRAAIGHGAAAVIFGHNHPSGSLQPSKADEALTQTLKAALALVDVRVLDHIIVSRCESLSMAMQGLL